MSGASVVNLIIEKGTDFESAFNLSGDDGGALNLKFTTASAFLKKHPQSLKSFPFNVGIITSKSEITISMGRTMTSQLPSGRNYFDVFINNTALDFVVRVVTGTVIVEDTTL